MIQASGIKIGHIVNFSEAISYFSAWFRLWKIKKNIYLIDLYDREIDI